MPPQDTSMPRSPICSSNGATGGVVAVADADPPSPRVQERPVECSSSSMMHEAWQLMRLVVPTIIIQIGTTLAPALTASYVGRYLGSVALDAFTLATLTGNLLTMALLWGLYSASDTLSPQAYGAANYKQVGLIALRGFYGSMILSIPINIILYGSMDDLLIYFGQDEQVSRLAAQWYRVYMCTIPFFALYNVTWKFLSAQHIVMPMIYVMIMSTFVILPLSLHILVPRFGFIGSAYALVLYQMAQSLLLILYIHIVAPHEPATWPRGLQKYREVLTDGAAFLDFFKLGAGGMLASVEWIWWEFVSLLIGTLGVVPLSVHTIAAQVIMVMYMLPLGTGTGLAIRLGGTLLPRNVRKAQRLVVSSCAVSAIIFSTISILLYTQRRAIIHCFIANGGSETQDAVAVGAEAIWWKVCVYNFFLCIFGIVTGIATGLGMQWTLGCANLFFLWLISLPGLYFNGIVEEHTLTAAWNWIFPSYMGMSILLTYKFVTVDWDAISLAIRKREGMMMNDVPWINSKGHKVVVNPHDDYDEVLQPCSPGVLATETTPLVV